MKTAKTILTFALALLAMTCALTLITNKLDLYQTCFIIGTMFTSVILGALIAKDLDETH